MIVSSCFCILCRFSIVEEDAKWKWKSLSHVRLFATPWTIQLIEFSRPEYWSGFPFPAPGDLPDPGIEPRSPALQADSLPSVTPGKLDKFYSFMFGQLISHKRINHLNSASSLLWKLHRINVLCWKTRNGNFFMRAKWYCALK